MIRSTSASSGAPAPGPVLLETLTATDLRNYRSLSVAVGAELVVLTGANGAGKTNFLEAISLLTPGRGLRRAPFEEIARIGSPGGWSVAARLGRGADEVRIGTGYAVGSEGEAGSRRIRINGATPSAAEAMLDYLRVLWLTPAMDGLFTGPAGDRRRFLDRLVLTVDPGHGRSVRDFEKLSAQRNRLLEEGGAPAWLDAVEAQLAEKAVALGSARAETVALLAARLGAEGNPHSAFPSGRIALSGDFDAMLPGRSAAEAELWYRGVLARNRPADRAAGRPLCGPNRSDLQVAFALKDMPAALSSTGEQKALLIGIVLAHAELVAAVSGMRPVLLLDEIAAHLDPGRRRALFERLLALGGQSFMSGTDPALFADLPAEAARLGVAEGRVDVLEAAAGGQIRWT